MISTRVRIALGVALALVFVCADVVRSVAQSAGSRVVERELRSKNFDHNKIGIGPVRKMVVYLPPGYDAASSKRYPVIYFLDGSNRFIFDHHNAQAYFDQAIKAGVIGGFVLVAVDMNTPVGSSLYVNSPVTGNWEDCMIGEIVPYIDTNFKTLPSRDSRGITGYFFGAYGAIRLGMRHPEVFGSVYGMNPVGTGSGVLTMASRPDWEMLANATSLDDVKKTGFPSVFLAIYQAALPDPNKPPLFVDLQARRTQEGLVIDPKLTARLRDNFLLETMIPAYAENLKSLRGFKFDWLRNDGIYDHVYSAQAFTHKLNEFGIVHEAEEYNGTVGDLYWGEEGRVSTDVLPFFQRHLVF